MKKILPIFTLVLACLNAQAQSLREFFTTMPDSVCPMLTRNNRLDCIDFLDSHMKAVVQNRFDQKSELKMLTDHYLLLEPTAASRMEILRLEGPEKPIFVVITHYDGPFTDSQLRIYDANWKEMPVKDYLDMPGLEDCLALPDSLADFQKENLRNQMDLPLLSISCNPETLVLNFSINTQALSRESQQSLKPYLRHFVRRWDKGQKHFI